MNIHLSDNELITSYKNSILCEFLVGSHLYGTNTESSDKDYLCIYVPSLNEINSFTNTHHQFQIKENGCDYILTNIQSFIRNLLNGDATINFELIHSESILNSPISFFYEVKDKFRTYNIIKAYLGFAKRDLNSYQHHKQLKHGIRSYFAAKKLLNFTYSNIPDDFLLSLYSEIDNNDYSSNFKLANSYLTKVNELRKSLNALHNNNEIVKYLDIDTQVYLDECVFDLLNSDSYKEKIIKYRNINLIYKYNETQIKY